MKQLLWSGLAVLSLICVFCGGGCRYLNAEKKAGPSPAAAVSMAQKAAQPPVIDGNLADTCWQNAPAVVNLTEPGTGAAPFRGTALKILYDDVYLYIGAWCAEPNPERLKAAGKPDQRVWEDDCLELFFQHTSEPGEYVQFISNTKDVHEDYMYLNVNSPESKWNPGWESRTKVLTNAWTSEIRIPLKEIGVRQPALAGDFVEFKVGREIWSDFKPGDPKHIVRYAVWPQRKEYNVGGCDFGRLYFTRKNLLPNPLFEGRPDAQGFYPAWGGDQNAPRYYKIIRRGGEVVVEVDAEHFSGGWMNTPVFVRPGDSYRYSLEMKGDAPATFLVRVPVPGENRTVPLAQTAGPFPDWTRAEMTFSATGTNTAHLGVYFGASARAPGKKIFFRNLEIAKEAAQVQPYYLAWRGQIKEPLPNHGLDALRQRRFGIKPYEMMAAKGCQEERVIFHDTSTGTPIWLMTRDRSNESYIYHKLEWVFSFNGKWLDISSDRLTDYPSKNQRWAVRTDGTAIMPMAKCYTSSRHWSPWNPDIYYYDLCTSTTGILCALNVETGERKEIAKLDPWRLPGAIYGWIVRPGRWSDRLVIIYPDHHTGFTIKRDGSERKDVVFVPPDGPEMGEPAFSTGFPDIMYTRDSIYRLEKDGGMTRLGALKDSRKLGFANLYQSDHHGDESKSDLYLARPEGTVTDPAGRVEKVYDPQPFIGLGGNMGCNGYASWGPTDDWFIMEHGQHFVRVRADGRGQDFLGFHFAKSLDYYSMAWGQVSPDGTKIVSKTTLLDNTDILMMIVAPPQPPVNIRLENDSLAWDAAPFSAETRGYFVYRSKTSGGPYEQVNREPVKERRWKLDAMEGPAFYAVSAVEHSGLESLLSAEAELNAGKAPRWFYAEAENLTLETPVVERREMAALGWHYVAQDAYLAMKRQKAGSLKWTLPVPQRLNGTECYLWLRARRAQTAEEGGATVQGGNTVGKVRLNDANWTWLRALDEAGKPACFIVHDGRLDLAFAIRNSSLEIDTLAITTEANGRPQSKGTLDIVPPHSPQGVQAESAGAGEIFVSWLASPDMDTACYNVYASASSTVTTDQKYLVGSPSKSGLLDWGLAAGSNYYYIVTAVDRQGNESAPCGAVMAGARTKPITTFHLEAEDAGLELSGDGPSLEAHGIDPECSGGKFVGVGVPGDENSFSNNPYALGERIRKLPAKRAALTWKINVAEAGEYVLWLKLRSRDREVVFDFTLDGKPAALNALTSKAYLKLGWYDARVAQSMWGQTDKAYRWFWTNVPVINALDPRPVRVKLLPGAHEFTLGNITPGLDVDAVVLTTDFAWIPEGTINYF